MLIIKRSVTAFRMKTIFAIAAVAIISMLASVSAQPIVGEVVGTVTDLVGGLTGGLLGKWVQHFNIQDNGEALFVM